MKHKLIFSLFFIVAFSVYGQKEKVDLESYNPLIEEEGRTASEHEGKSVVEEDSNSRAFLVPPKPENFIYDELDLFTYEEESALKKELSKLSREHGAEVFIATLPNVSSDEANDVVGTLNNKWGRQDFRIVILGIGNEEVYISHGALPKEYIKGAPMKRMILGVYLDAKRIKNFKQRILFMTEEYNAILKSLSARSDVFKQEQLDELLKQYNIKKQKKVRIWFAALALFLLLLLMFYIFFMIYSRTKSLAFPEVYPRDRLGGNNSGGSVHVYPSSK